MEKCLRLVLRFGFFVFFFGCLRAFLFFRLGNFHRLQGRKKKTTKKPKSWEKCCAQRFPPGDCFFWFLCFFLFSLKFFGFGFMILCGLCPTWSTKPAFWGVTITKTTIFVRYKNQSHHFNWKGLVRATDPQQQQYGNYTGAQAPIGNLLVLQICLFGSWGWDLIFLEMNVIECWQWCTRTGGLDIGFSSDVFRYLFR